MSRAIARGILFALPSALLAWAALVIAMRAAL
jgi:hypothetical protein